MSANGCPGDHALHLFLEGNLEPSARTSLTGHLATCDSCQHLIAELGKADNTLPSASRGANPADPWPPLQLDEYQLLRPLGQGAMGDVYLAHDTTLRRQVAIKFLARSGEEATARLLREARAVARLQHPNVVGIFRVGEAAGHPYLVTEYVEGGTLADAARPMPAARVVEIGIALGRGLEAAHAQGLLHRDIKLQNVVLTKEGIPKLLDFGLARSEPDHATALDPLADASLTVTGALVGTPRYLAPEVWAGRPASPQSDLYAFGVVLYELLTGRPPFIADTLDALRNQVARLEPPRLEAVPRPLAAVVGRCLARDPAQRFASAAQVVAALTRLQVRRAWPAWLAAAALVVLVAGGSTWLQRTEHSVGKSAVPAAQRAFDEGLAQLRNAEDARARASFARALKEDPAFATAALWATYLEPDGNQARAYLSIARDHRAQLDARGRAFHEALSPGVRPMKNVPSWLKELERLVDAHPKQVELRMLRAEALTQAGDHDSAMDELRTAEAVDPSFAARLAAARGLIEHRRNRPEAAREEFSQCLTAARDAIDCLEGRSHILSLVGDCDGMERDARRWSALDPASPKALEALAYALHAGGAPTASVAETLKLRRDLQAPTARAKSEWLDAFRLEAAQGHLEAARGLARKAAEDPGLGPTLRAHTEPTLRWVLALRELGDDSELARVSDDFLSRSAAWAAESTQDVAQAQLVAAVAYTPGKPDRRLAAVAAIERAAAAEGRSDDPYTRSMIWLAGWAAWTQTRGDAEEALAALPRYLPLPLPGVRPIDTNLTIGINLLLAGKGRDAGPYLEAAARSCRKLENPIASVLALYWVGRLRAELGDPAGARQAFTAFLAVWPNVKRADEVRKRLAALP